MNIKEVDFYRAMYVSGKKTGLFKSISDKNQNLQVADFQSVPGPIDIHLTFNPRPTSNTVKNLHITVRYRGLSSENVTTVNEINRKKGLYKKDKQDPSVSFYLDLENRGGKRCLKLVKGTAIPSEIKVNIQSYIDRVNHLISFHMT